MPGRGDLQGLGQPGDPHGTGRSTSREQEVPREGLCRRHVVLLWGTAASTFLEVWSNLDRSINAGMLGLAKPQPSGSASAPRWWLCWQCPSMGQCPHVPVPLLPHLSPQQAAALAAGTMRGLWALALAGLVSACEGKELVEGKGQW